MSDFAKDTNVPINDCISRQAAIDALGERPMAWTDNEFDLGLVVQFDADRRMLEAVPSADVQPVRHGHWVFGNTLGHSWMKCSECLVSQNGQTATYTYCPNCGAKMDEV